MFLPDLIILDINLPQVDGFQILSIIRNHPALARTFVVMLTARQEKADIKKGFEIGADDYVVKPFSAIELAARVARLIRQKSR